MLFNYVDNQKKSFGGHYSLKTCWQLWNGWDKVADTLHPIYYQTTKLQLSIAGSYYHLIQLWKYSSEMFCSKRWEKLGSDWSVEGTLAVEGFVKTCLFESVTEKPEICGVWQSVIFLGLCCWFDVWNGAECVTSSAPSRFYWQTRTGAVR